MSYLTKAHYRSLLISRRNGVIQAKMRLRVWILLYYVLDIIGFQKICPMSAGEIWLSPISQRPRLAKAMWANRRGRQIIWWLAKPKRQMYSLYLNIHQRDYEHAYQIKNGISALWRCGAERNSLVPSKVFNKWQFHYQVDGSQCAFS